MKTVEVFPVIFQFTCPECDESQDVDFNSIEYDRKEVECNSCHKEFKIEIAT